MDLSHWMGRGLAFEIEQHNKRVSQALRKRLLAMELSEFEELIARLLPEIKTPRSPRESAMAESTSRHLGHWECHQYPNGGSEQKMEAQNNVQAPLVQQVCGSLGTHE